MLKNAWSIICNTDLYNMYFKSKANIKPVLYVNELFIYQNLAILEQVPLYLIEIFRLSDKYQENWKKN